jgi:mono/diheme cytochrome c family protein
MNKSPEQRWIGSSLVALMSLMAAGCTVLGGAQADSQALESDIQALQEQLAATVPVQVVQAGQLAPPPPNVQPSGWDTEESLRSGLRLLATYDSGGPDAWDVDAHPLVFFTSEGVGSNPNGGTPMSGVQIIDAYEKKVVASALFDLGEEVTQNPHSAGMSPDGRYLYIGQMHRVAATGQTRSVLLIINARTLKLEMTLEGPRADWFHHITGFTDWQGRDRVIVAFGRNAGGGPTWLLDPKDNNRVVRAITIQDVGDYMGHPYPTVDPTGRFLYNAVFAAPWRSKHHDTAGIAKINLETGGVIIVPYVGDNPIGMAHTSDGRFTYVNDGHSSFVYKIDNELNEVVDSTSAGVAGPYGIALNWDETFLYPIGKGEGTHNNGSVVGLVATQPRFMSPRNFIHNMPIWLGGSASSVDHGILHPDPRVNELWISNMNGWEIIVLNLDTHEPTDYIATPNGGDTHSGGFARYNADWTGELLVDMGGPKNAVREIMRERVAAVPAPAGRGGRGGRGAAAAAPAPAAPAGTLAERGRLVFEQTAGGVGCASCHGMDGAGDAGLSTPDIRGADEARVRPALAGVALMSGIRLTETELEAVLAHLQTLNLAP